MGKYFRQTQRHGRHKHDQWSHQDTLLLYDEDYSQEKHNVWNGMRVCVCYMDRDWANTHNQKLVEAHSWVLHEEVFSVEV